VGPDGLKGSLLAHLHRQRGDGGSASLHPWAVSLGCSGGRPKAEHFRKGHGLGAGDNPRRPRPALDPLTPNDVDGIVSLVLSHPKLVLI
jgi:hypothetical protein